MGKQVTLASIEKAIDIIDNLDDDQLESVSEKYALAQQILLDYVASAATEYRWQNRSAPEPTLQACKLPDRRG